MRLFARHRAEIPSRAPSHRLLWASLLLALLLLLTFGAALFLFISLHNTKKDTVRSLEIQYAVFQNDMERYFDQLAGAEQSRAGLYVQKSGADTPTVPLLLSRGSAVPVPSEWRTAIHCCNCLRELMPSLV